MLSFFVLFHAEDKCTKVQNGFTDRFPHLKHINLVYCFVVVNSKRTLNCIAELKTKPLEEN